MRQESFDPFDYEVSAKEALTNAGGTSQEIIVGWRGIASAMAKKERDDRYRQLKANGRNVARFTSTNQLEKYRSFGVDGRGYRSVYYINIEGEI